MFHPRDRVGLANELREEEILPAVDNGLDRERDGETDVEGGGEKEGEADGEGKGDSEAEVDVNGHLPQGTGDW